MKNPISFLLYVIAVILAVIGIFKGWQWILAGIAILVISYLIGSVNGKQKSKKAKSVAPMKVKAVKPIKKAKAVKPVKKKPKKTSKAKKKKR